MSTPGRLLVVADHYRLALRYAREHDLGHPGERWRYVGCQHDALALRGPGRFVVVDPLLSNVRALQVAEIRQTLTSNGFETLEAIDPSQQP